MKLAGMWHKPARGWRQVFLIVGIVCLGFAAGAYGILYGQPVPLEPVAVRSNLPAAQAPSVKHLSIRGAGGADGKTEIRNPFSRLHEKKEMKASSPVVNHVSQQAEKVPPGLQDKVVQAAEPFVPQELHLTGIVTGKEKSMALFSCQGEEFSLSPGEEKQGIHLLSVAGDEVVVRDVYGERVLQLQN